jgi:hypothetical protein
MSWSFRKPVLRVSTRLGVCTYIYNFVRCVAVDTGRQLHAFFPVQRFIIPKNNYESRTQRMTECKSPGEERRLGKCTNIRKRYAIILKFLTCVNEEARNCFNLNQES